MSKRFRRAFRDNLCSAASVTCCCCRCITTTGSASAANALGKGGGVINNLGHHQQRRPTPISSNTMLANNRLAYHAALNNGAMKRHLHHPDRQSSSSHGTDPFGQHVDDRAINDIVPFELQLFVPATTTAPRRLYSSNNSRSLPDWPPLCCTNSDDQEGSSDWMNKKPAKMG